MVSRAYRVFMADRPDRMTEAEFAKRVGLSKRTIERLRLARLIRYRQIQGRIYYLEEDVAAFDEAAKRDVVWPKTRTMKAAS